MLSEIAPPHFRGSPETFGVGWSRRGQVAGLLGPGPAVGRFPGGD